MSAFLTKLLQFAGVVLQYLPVITNFLREVVKFFKSNASACGLGFIICFLTNCILDPDGAINQFMITCIDLIVDFFPSTPNQYKLYSMLNSFASQFPLIGWGVIYEIFQGIVGMTSIYLIVKLWRFLPFGGSS